MYAQTFQRPRSFYGQFDRKPGDKLTTHYCPGCGHGNIHKMIAEAKEKAKTEYNRIVTDAQAAIEQQKNAAIIDVKNLIGKMVVEVTEKLIRKELVSTKDHEEYILKLADDLTNTNGNARN